MILKISNLEAAYNGMQVLKDLSFGVEEGEIVSVIGPNGSGKSTLFKAIAGLLRPVRGSITFKDKAIENKQVEEIIQAGLAYAPQGHRVFPNLTVEENLWMGGYLYRRQGTLEKREKEVYELFPTLKANRSRQASFLSGGEQQMLSIARALMMMPKLLLLDEPSLGISRKASIEVFRKIVELNRQGITILLAEQNIQMALAIAHKVIFLEAGRLVYEGTSEATKEFLAHKGVIYRQLFTHLT